MENCSSVQKCHNLHYGKSVTSHGFISDILGVEKIDQVHTKTGQSILTVLYLWIRDLKSNRSSCSDTFLFGASYSTERKGINLWVSSMLKVNKSRLQANSSNIWLQSKLVYSNIVFLTYQFLLCRADCPIIIKTSIRYNHKRIFDVSVICSASLRYIE